MTRGCLCVQADLTIETKGIWPMRRDAAACLGLAGLAVAATTALELRARAAYAKRRSLPPAAYGTYWRALLSWT